MHFTDQWVIMGVKWSKPCWLSAADFFWFYYHLYCCSDVTCIYLFPEPVGSEEWWKGLESQIKQEKVASVSPLKGFSVTFPAAEVCVSHWVVCCEAAMDLYPFANVVLKWEIGNCLHFASKLGFKHWGMKGKVWLTLQSDLKDVISTSKLKNASATWSRGNLWTKTAWFPTPRV